MSTPHAPVRLPILIAAACLLSGITPTRAQPGERVSAQALIDQSDLESRIDPEASRHEAESALDLLRREPNVDLEIRARLQLCEYFSERDQDLAAQQIAAANVLLPQAQRQALRAGILNCEGETAQTLGNNEQAAQSYRQAIAVATATHDDQMLAEALVSQGYLLGLQGEFASGLNDLRTAQTLFEQLKRPNDALTALLGIATVYNRMGDYSEATQLYERALEAQRRAGLKREQSVTLLNLGRAHQNLQRLEQARDAFNASLDLSTQLGYTRMQAYALRGLASVASARGEANEAMALLDRAQTYQSQTRDARLQAQIQLARGIALHQLKRLKESAAVLMQALTVFRQAQSPGELDSTYDELASVSSDLGNWRDAYDYRTLAQSTATQLLRNQLDQRFASLKVEFDTATQQKANSLLMLENRANQLALAQQLRARNLQTTVIVLTVLLLGVLATLAVRQRRNTLRMRRLAMTDELTDLPNRRAVLAYLGHLVRRSSTPTAILIIDIDHFKSVNDRYGHLIGDETLKLVTANLRDALAEPAFFGRLGGEEFAALLPSTGLETAMAIAEKLRERVTRIDLSRWLGDRRITISIGVATSGPNRDTTSSILRRADAALYAAKDAGRNCVRNDQSERDDHITPRVA